MAEKIEQHGTGGGPPEMEPTTIGAGLSAEELLPGVYDDLRRIAASRIARLSPGQTLQPTALVHEAYMKLVGEHDPRWRDREHFIAAVAQVMRHILVDSARRKATEKHGGGRLRITLMEPVVAARAQRDWDMIEIDGALRRLEEFDERKGRIVTLRFFGGLTIGETSAALGVSSATIEREWAYAKAWLHRELSRCDGG